MTPIQIILALCNIITGIVIIGFAIPVIKRRIGPNQWYGFRICKTFQSDELWYDINAYGGRQMLIWAIPMIAAGVACLFIPLSDPPPLDLLLLLSCGPVVAFTIIPIVITLIYAGKKKA